MKSVKIVTFTALVCVAASLVILYARSSRTYPKIDFDVSMRKADFSEAFREPHANPVYARLKELYDMNYQTTVAADAPYRIPKILHQVWLGSPFPEKYKKFRDSWLEKHPDWEYRLWTEKEIEELGMTNKDLYDFACNYGERSDLAKYEIIYRYGGVYIDTDYVCLEPLDHIHQAYDFYIGIQPLDTRHVQIGLGLFGASKGHPILAECINRLSQLKKEQNAIVLRTGPVFFTFYFHDILPRYHDRVIALPASYLYPMGYFQKSLPESEWRRPESLAVHLWEGSWLSDEAFVKE